MKTPRLISFKLAQKIIIREKKKLFQESKIKLKEAHNTVASRTITSPINLPLQNTAGLDGYIVSNKNLNKVSISNKLLNAGHSYKRLNPNLAYKINTGGIIPHNFKNFISLENAKVDQNKKVSDWDDKEIASIREVVGILTIEGELRSETQLNIKRLMDIGSYRGIRHRTGLPLRGQRTKNNSRTRKGKRKTVANKKKATK